MPGRGLDCKHAAHEDVHFSGADDQDLQNQVRAHRNEYHPELSDGDIRNIVAVTAYDK